MIEDKLKDIELLDKSVSYSVICEKYGIGKSTVGDIKKNRQKILQFRSTMVDMGMSRKVIVMAVYIWFKQKRMEGVPISGAEKVVDFSETLNGEESGFKASEGWKWQFCRRHGIRQLSMQGEKLSADKEAADTFVCTFRKLVKEKNLSSNQIFNCDETAWSLLPTFTRCHPLPKFRKVSRWTEEGKGSCHPECVLEHVWHHKTTHPLDRQGTASPMLQRSQHGSVASEVYYIYSGQTNAWMTSKLFCEWFHNDFVPHVRDSLKLLKETPQAVLLLDNCSAHPDEEELVSDDGKIYAHFLPPNVTSLIQPMDQGVLEAIKKRYKKKLLRRLIIEDDLGGSIISFIKSVNMKTVIDLAVESWGEITQSTLRKSWRRIIPIPSASSVSMSTPLPGVLADLFHQADDSEDNTQSCTSVNSSQSRGCCIWRGTRIRIHHSQDDREEMPISEDPEDSEPGLTSFQTMFKELGFDMDEDQIFKWLEYMIRMIVVFRRLRMQKSVNWCPLKHHLKIQMNVKKKMTQKKFSVLCVTVKLLACLKNAWHGLNINRKLQHTTYVGAQTVTCSGC